MSFISNKIIFFLFLSISFIAGVNGQPVLQKGWYKITIQRPDAAEIIFNAELVQKNNKTLLYIRNGVEKLVVDDIKITGDSVVIDMPFFESSFKLKMNADQSLAGKWIKGTSNKNLELPVVFQYGSKERFEVETKAIANITGRWQVTFTRSNGTERPAIAQFQQKENYLAGTFLTPSGDYRYLEGVVNGNRLLLSCFDGSHAYSFTAQITNHEITNGYFYSSASNAEKWRAVKNNTAALPDTIERTALKPGETKLNFAFKDVNGRTVSINDAKYKNKVVVLQIMGSWCPNCMDESKFLSQFYKTYKSKGVEIIALAYEYSLDEKRSRASIQKFINRFNIQYPVLIAPATVSDEQKTEKTLPQLTPIKFFPTTIFIGKDRTVQKVHSGFYGPGTGAFYEQFKTEFYRTIQSLLAE